MPVSAKSKIGLIRRKCLSEMFVGNCSDEKHTRTKVEKLTGHGRQNVRT